MYRLSIGSSTKEFDDPSIAVAYYLEALVQKSSNSDIEFLEDLLKQQTDKITPMMCRMLGIEAAYFLKILQNAGNDPEQIIVAANGLKNGLLFSDSNDSCGVCKSFTKDFCTKKETGCHSKQICKEFSKIEFGYHELFGKAKKYIQDSSQAPKGVPLKQGPKGGMYYEQEAKEPKQEEDDFGIEALRDDPKIEVIYEEMSKLDNHYEFLRRLRQLDKKYMPLFFKNTDPSIALEALALFNNQEAFLKYVYSNDPDIAHSCIHNLDLEHLLKIDRNLLRSDMTKTMYDISLARYKRIGIEAALKFQKTGILDPDLIPQKLKDYIRRIDGEHTAASELADLIQDTLYPEEMQSTHQYLKRQWLDSSNDEGAGILKEASRKLFGGQIYHHDNVKLDHWEDKVQEWVGDRELSEDHLIEYFKRTHNISKTLLNIKYPDQQEFTLYRGTTYHELAEGAEDMEIEEGDEARINSNSLSSWSLKDNVASKFADSSDGVVLQRTATKDEIFASFLNYPFHSGYEAEFILIGQKDPAKGKIIYSSIADFGKSRSIYLPDGTQYRLDSGNMHDWQQTQEGLFAVFSIRPNYAELIDQYEHLNPSDQESVLLTYKVFADPSRAVEDLQKKYERAAKFHELQSQHVFTYFKNEKKYDDAEDKVWKAIKPPSHSVDQFVNLRDKFMALPQILKEKIAHDYTKAVSEEEKDQALKTIEWNYNEYTKSEGGKKNEYLKDFPSEENLTNWNSKLEGKSKMFYQMDAKISTDVDFNDISPESADALKYEFSQLLPSKQLEAIDHYDSWKKTTLSEYGVIVKSVNVPQVGVFEIVPPQQDEESNNVIRKPKEFHKPKPEDGETLRDNQPDTGEGITYHTGGNPKAEFYKTKVYVQDPSQAPKGVPLRQGRKGGTYYNQEDISQETQQEKTGKYNIQQIPQKVDWEEESVNIEFLGREAVEKCQETGVLDIKLIPEATKKYIQTSKGGVKRSEQLGNAISYLFPKNMQYIHNILRQEWVGDSNSKGAALLKEVAIRKFGGRVYYHGNLNSENWAASISKYLKLYGITFEQLDEYFDRNKSITKSLLEIKYPGQDKIKLYRGTTYKELDFGEENISAAKGMLVNINSNSLSSWSSSMDTADEFAVADGEGIILERAVPIDSIFAFYLNYNFPAANQSEFEVIQGSEPVHGKILYSEAE